MYVDNRVYSVHFPNRVGRGMLLCERYIRRKERGNSLAGPICHCPRQFPRETSYFFGIFLCFSFATEIKFERCGMLQNKATNIVPFYA